MDATIRTDSQLGGWDSGRCKSTAIRLANNSTACVDNTVRWAIKQDHANELFQQYRTDDNIRDSLVTRELTAVINDVFAGYNPFATGGDIPNLDTLSAAATKGLQAKIGRWVNVENVIIPIVHFDDATQGKINALQAAIADTRIAEQKQHTASAEADANRILAASVSNDPNVLVSKCLDLAAQGKLPSGFLSCWPMSAPAPVVSVK